MVFKGFPNWHENIEDIIAEGDKVWVLEKVAGHTQVNWNFWGAYTRRASLGLNNRESYDYYVTHKDYSNYTSRIPVGTTVCPLFDMRMFGGPWTGTDLQGKPVSPGIYHIYPIVYGRILEPINLTVTSVFWNP